MTIADLLQIAGAFAILVPFVASQRSSLAVDTALYLWPNALGSALLALLALVESQWGFVLLEVTWSVVAFAGLLRLSSR
jgi:hypothetical protein